MENFPDRRIGSIGLRIDDPRVQAFDYDSDYSLLGHDVLLLDLERGVKRSVEEEKKTARDIELGQHLELGKPVVILVPPPSEIILIGEGYVDISALLPISLKTVLARGRNFQVLSGNPFRTFWRVAERVSTYEAYMPSPPGQPLLGIRDSTHVVASVTRVKQGVVLLLPNIASPLDLGGRRAAGELVDALFLLLEQLSPRAELAEWTSRYVLPAESDACDRLAGDRQQLEELAHRIARGEDDLQSRRERKLLFAGTGVALERVVEAAFRGLGCEVDPGAPGRTDRIVRHADDVAVVEVKGRTGSASERDAAQLQKWVSDYHAEHGTQPKGILVVNAWSDRPLEDRTQPAFPHQMLRYAADQQEQCLITGLQLLGAWLRAEAHPSEQSQIRDSIFGCVGVYEEFSDWSEWLETDETLEPG